MFKKTVSKALWDSPNERHQIKCTSLPKRKVKISSFHICKE